MTKAALRRMASAPSTKFTAERLEAFARDLKSGRVPLARQQVSDDIVVGLRAMCHKSGLITLSSSYYVGDKRGHMKIGELHRDSPDYISIEDARELTKTIKVLGELGIDPQESLMRRLVKELRRDGVKWRPK